MIERIKVRLSLSDDSKDSILKELINTITDRLCLLLKEEALPKKFESICVDAVVKAYRRIYFEGITQEGVEGISTAFVDNILDEYRLEIDSWINSNKGIVKFI